MTLDHKILYADKRLLFLFSGLFLPTMTMGILQFSYGLIPAGLSCAFLIIIGGLLLGIIAAIIERQAKTKLYYWLLLTSLLTFLSVVSFFFIANMQHATTDRRSEQIINALEAYRSDQEQYPDNLERLKNTYLDKVPSTAYGVLRQDFGYTRTTPNEYELYYYSYIGVAHWYNSKTKDWITDD